MARTRSVRRRPEKSKPHKRSAVWIVGSVLGVGLCILGVSYLWPSAPSTAATDPAPAEPAVAAPATDGSRPQPAEPRVPYYGYRVVKTYPHNAEDFTQGLVYSDGFLYEGTGLYGQSALMKRTFVVEAREPNEPNRPSDPNESEPIFKRIRLPEQYFGEGITLFGDRIIQVTWQSRKGFVYDKETLRQIGTFEYNSQGWGLTHDGKRLILSDGTATLHFLDPNTFAETGQLRVYDQRRPIRQINELEYIDGLIYANIWPTDYIAVISPENGRVVAWINLTGLHIPPPSDDNNVVTNGIAYLPENKHLLVTGKLWPHMYEIELVPLDAPNQTP